MPTSPRVLCNKRKGAKAIVSTCKFFQGAVSAPPPFVLQKIAFCFAKFVFYFAKFAVVFQNNEVDGK